MTLRVAPLTELEARAWAHVHNEVIPTSPLTEDDVRGKLNLYVMSLAYVDDMLVGNATLRLPSADDDAATVIVRILPQHRRQGYGLAYAEHLIAQAAGLGVERLGTVVLESNVCGLRFAEMLGYTEVKRYEHHGARFVHLTRSGVHPA